MAKAKPPVKPEKQDGYIIKSMENVITQLPTRIALKVTEKTKQSEKNYAELVALKEHISRICAMLNNDERISVDELSSKVPPNSIKQWIKNNAIQLDIDQLFYHRDSNHFFKIVDPAPYILSNTMYDLEASERNHNNIPCLEHLKQTILKEV
jgi:hypothetical protein